MGVREPAYFRLVPDQVEALVALGRLDEAETFLDAFEEAGRNLGRAWTIATGARSRARVLAARCDLAGASAAADEAMQVHDNLALPFELGRTLLVRGAVERRAKRKREARDTLTKALEVFDGLGAALWADTTRAELAWLGGRAPSSVDPTPTEARVAELVAAGSTNRKAADALFVSVHTIEANLKRIYRKCTSWTLAVSVLAVAALILSGLALNTAGRGDRSARMLAETDRVRGTSPVWDAGSWRRWRPGCSPDSSIDSAPRAGPISWSRPL